MAGAGGPTPSGRGGRRSLDFALNMVPFIDLLSALLAFLLLSAAFGPKWVLDTTTPLDAAGSEKEDSNVPSPPLRLSISPSGYRLLGVEPPVSASIERSGELWDRQQLHAFLRGVRQDHPEMRRLEVSVDDRVPYEELIAAMDLALSLGLDALSVAGE